MWAFFLVLFECKIVQKHLPQENAILLEMFWFEKSTQHKVASKNDLRSAVEHLHKVLETIFLWEAKKLRVSKNGFRLAVGHNALNRKKSLHNKNILLRLKGLQTRSEYGHPDPTCNFISINWQKKNA